MSAAELHKMGVVDVLATDGQGETAVRNWIAKNAKRRNGLQAVHRARQFIHPITREELDGIFQPFRGSFGKGTGLGLAIVRRIVAEHGGAIEVGENVPRGTRFTIELPC